LFTFNYTGIIVPTMNFTFLLGHVQILGHDFI